MPVNLIVDLCALGMKNVAMLFQLVSVLLVSMMLVLVLLVLTPRFIVGAVKMAMKR